MSLWNLTKTYSGDVPPRTTTAIYCGASAFRDACYQLVSAFLITYITFSGLLDVEDPATYLAQMGVISTLIFLYRIWDGINDPIMGWIIEKFHFKWGKYKPWILIGAIANSIVVLTLFLAHPRGWGFVVLFAIFYFLWDFAITINDIAYWSMLPSLTSDEARRNRITSIMQIFISIGVFAIYGAVTLLVGDVDRGSSAQTTYGTIAIVVTSLFLLSQVILVFGCKEHVRDAESEKREIEDSSFKDMFLVFKKNNQFRINIIALLLQYLSAGALVAFAMYYCYIVFGYGSLGGGTVSFMLTITYAIGTLASQGLYPILTKKLNRKQMLLIAAIGVIIGYSIFFFTGFPIFTEKPICLDNQWIVYVGALILFFGQGIVSIAIVMQMQSTIEYNEWKFGERKEAIVSSMRAMAAKWGNAIQQGLVYGTLAISGLYSLTQSISNYENSLNALGAENAEVQAKYDEMIATLSGATSNQLLILGVGMIIVPMLLMLTTIFLCGVVFKIDEKKYNEIIQDLAKRKKEKAN